jgi:hypothetical protein
MPLLCIVQKGHAAFYKFSNFNTTMLLHSRNGLQRKKKKSCMPLFAQSRSGMPLWHKLSIISAEL